MIGEYDTVLHSDAVLSHVRADGFTVSLHRAFGYSVAVWMPGNKLARPIDIGLMGDVPATAFMRRCAEPVALPDVLVEDIRAMLKGMCGLKPAERALFNQAIADGAATLLAVRVRELSTRKGGDRAIELALRVEAERTRAIEALPAELRASLDAIVTEQKARRAQREARS